MKYLRLVLLLSAATHGLAFAQDEEQRRAPPTEIPDFSNLDEYIYEPKSTVIIGVRHLSGAKASFSGQGSIGSAEDPGLATGANLTRTYHDGRVNPDTRVAARLDTSGNPIIDPQTGSQVFDPIAADGRTNSWSFSDNAQVTPDGYVAFHTFSADVIDTGSRARASNSTNGLDLSVSRDMGRLFGTRLSWNITAGMSVNDISANTVDQVLATLRTLTDFYSLYGVTPPDAPYTAPSSSTTTVLDASGNAVVNADGSTQTITVDTTVLLGNEPAGRDTSSATNDTNVANRWQLKGAYYTFRAGPTLWVPISSRFRASVSLGAAVIYSGTNYTVTQTLQPDFGAEISDTHTSSAYKLLPGYYADATLQYDLTERAGFYAGAVFQSAGSYTQSITNETANYATKIDLGNQSGLRAGMTIRF
ncbi:MAG: hypothetical protein Q7S40_18980 [Opitutaceae bacterium]|nr:hypothetical protein [Opitutaceae bacterium]